MHFLTNKIIDFLSISFESSWFTKIYPSSSLQTKNPTNVGLDYDSTMRSIIFCFKMIIPMVIGFTFLIIKSCILFIF